MLAIKYSWMLDYDISATCLENILIRKQNHNSRDGDAHNVGEIVKEKKKRKLVFSLSVTISLVCLS